MQPGHVETLHFQVDKTFATLSASSATQTLLSEQINSQTMCMMQSQLS